MPTATSGFEETMKPISLALALLLLPVLGCGDDDQTQFCSFNSDCPEQGKRFCVNGLCRSQECRVDRDCDDGESCVEGACTTPGG